MDDPDAFDVVAGCFSILLINDKAFQDQPRYIETRVLQELSRMRPSLRIVWEESAYRNLKEVVRAFSDSPGNGKAYSPPIFAYSQRAAREASVKGPHFKLSSDVHKLWFASYDRDSFAEHLRDVLLRGKRSLERQAKKAKKELGKWELEQDAGDWGADEWAEGGWDGADANAWEGDWGAPESASAAAASPSEAENKAAAPAEKAGTQRRQRIKSGVSNDWGATGYDWCESDDWGSSARRAPAESVAATEGDGVNGESPSAAASPSPAVLGGERSGSGKGGGKQVKGNKTGRISQKEDFL